MADLKLALALSPGAALDPSVRAFRTVLALAHTLRTRMDERLRADGLTTMQAAVLTAVIQLDGATGSALAGALGTSRQNIAQLVASLRAKGMLAVEQDPQDQRRQRLIATPRATSYWAERDEGDLAAVRQWFSPLTADELAELISYATRLLDPPTPAPGA